MDEKEAEARPLMGTIFLVYRLALPLRAPEKFSSLSKSRIP